MICQQPVKKPYIFVLRLYLASQWNIVSSTWHDFPLKHIPYLMNTWLPFSFLMFKKNGIPFFSGFGSGWLPEMQSTNCEGGVGKAERLLYSTNGVTGFSHSTIWPFPTIPCGLRSSPGGGRRKAAFCLLERAWHLMTSSRPQPPEMIASSSALALFAAALHGKALVCIL